MGLYIFKDDSRKQWAMKVSCMKNKINFYANSHIKAPSKDSKQLHSNYYHNTVRRLSNILIYIYNVRVRKIGQICQKKKSFFFWLNMLLFIVI